MRPIKHWIRSYDPTIYNFIRALKEQGYVHWNQKKNKYSVGDIIYLYASRPIQRIVYKLEVVATDIEYYEGLDNDEDYYVNYDNDVAEDGNSICIKVVPVSINLGTRPSYKDLQEIGVLNLRSANTLSPDKVEKIERLFTACEIEHEPAEPICVSIGSKVRHTKFGDGIVKSLDDRHIVVEFTGEETTFLYPSAFYKGFLKQI